MARQVTSVDSLYVRYNGGNVDVLGQGCDSLGVKVGGVGGPCVAWL